MNKINILPKQEAQKIAAGEVVERPSSIVKELVENSIDAKSTQISIYIKKAGKQLIRIVDNGHGMSKDDALICFQPHSTSKITSVDDLEHIDSFGFRGEALGSIASVSKVTLATGDVKLKYIDGEFITEESFSHNGLDISIEDLFYNTPARKKFLKQDETEWNHILHIIHCFALSNINIHFKLYRDEKLLLNLPKANDLKSRASQIFGHNFAENLIKVDSHDVIKISGLISNHQFWRYNRNNILFFVNGRFIKNYKLSNALLKGYLNVLPPNKFPAAIMMITIDKTTVDINVHPRKEEVLFSKPLLVENQVKNSVKQALETYISKQISHQSKPTMVTEPSITNFNFDSNPFKNIQTVEPENFNTKSTVENFTDLEVQAKNTSSYESVSKPNLETVVNASINTAPRINIIGQIMQTYILIEQDRSLTIVDQHAAHERILYEQFKTKFEALSGTRLLFPELIKLDEKFIPMIMSEKEFFKSVGVEIELFGDNQIAVKSSPPKLHSNSLKEFILEIAHFIEEHEHLDSQELAKILTEHTHSHMACKMAVRAGDILSKDEMLNLVTKLQSCNNRLICVHGRPTMWVVSQDEIEKKFKRKV